MAMSAGYSNRSLAQKLGIKAGSVVALVNAPDNYDKLLGVLPEGVTVVGEPKKDVEFIQVFVTRRNGLENQVLKLKDRLKPDGMLWISWPKRSSKLATDLSDSVVREVGLRNGLVDVKVCAVDESWSGLKFVRRLKDRPVDSHPKKRKDSSRRLVCRARPRR
jgi:hypothetical protein